MWCWRCLAALPRHSRWHTRTWEMGLLPGHAGAEAAVPGGHLWRRLLSSQFCCGPQYVQKCGRDGIRTIRFLVLHAALDASNELSKRSRSRPTCFRLPAPRRVRQG